MGSPACKPACRCEISPDAVLFSPEMVLTPDGNKRYKKMKRDGIKECNCCGLFMEENRFSNKPFTCDDCFPNIKDRYYDRDSRMRNGGRPGAFSTWPLRECTVCHEEKNPATDFRRREDTGNALNTCEECRLNQERARRKKARAEGRWHRKRAHEMTSEQLERNRARQRRHAAKKRATPKGNIYNRMSRQIWQHIKGQKNRRSWVDLLPYTIDELVAHLEAQFVDGISWDNMNEWHIDHIRPVSSFNYESTDDPEFLECWALENLQPLWGPDNCRKGAKYEP